MKTTSRTKWSLRLLVVLSMVIGGGSAAGASAAEVQACVSRGSPLGIGADPAECAAGDRVDAISVKFALSAQPGGGAQPGPLLLAKRLDQASTQLFLDTALRRQLSSVLVVIFEGNGAKDGRGQRLFSILLGDATLAGFEESAEPGRASLGAHEIVSFAYARITLRDDVSGESSCFDFLQMKTC